MEGADSQPKVSHDVAGGEVPVAQSREEGTAEVSSEERFKQSICLPTVFVPRQLHSAIEVAIAGKCDVFLSQRIRYCAVRWFGVWLGRGGGGGGGGWVGESGKAVAVYFSVSYPP